MIPANKNIHWPTICIFGDSITEGTGDDTGQGWADRLKADWRTPRPGESMRANIYNLGVDGDRVADIATRFDTESAARNPHAIVLSAGINDLPWADGRPVTSLGEFHMAYQNLLELAVQRTRHVLVLSLLNVNEKHGDHGIRNDDILEYNKVIHSVAAERGAIYLNFFGLMEADDLSDGVHPNGKGYVKLYLAVKAELEQRGWDH
jgi:lysophospholipase L1-like esterase